MKSKLRRLKDNVYAKMLILFLTVAILPSMLASILSYQVSITNAMEQSHQFSEQLLTQMRSANDITYEEMQAFIYEIMIQFNRYSEVLAKLPYTSDYLDIWNSLDKKRQAYQKRIKNFSLIDLSSGKILSSYSGIAVYNIEDYSKQQDGSLIDMAFSESVSDSTNDLRLRRSGGEDVLTYIYKYGSSANLKGYITVDIEVSKISLSDASNVNGNLFVRNSHGMLLTNRNEDLYNVLSAGQDRRGYMIISETSDISGLQYDYVIPKKSIVQNNRILLWSILSICLILMLLGALVALLSSKNIYTPLRELLRYIRQMTGERNAVPEESNGEGGLNDFRYLERTFTSLSQENKQYLSALRNNQGMFRQRQLSMLLSGNIKDYETLVVPDKFRLTYTLPDFAVFVIELEYLPDFKAKYTVLEQELLYFAIQNITEETLGEAGQAATCRMESHRIAAVLNYDADRFGQERLNEWGRKLQSQVNEYLHLQVSIGVNGPGSGISSIKNIYEQALRAVSYKVYFGRNSVIPYGTLTKLDEARTEDVGSPPWTEVREQLKLDFRSNDWKRIASSIRGIVEHVSYVGITQTEVHFVFLQFVSTLSDICQEFALPLAGVFGEPFSIHRAAEHLSTMEELQEGMLSLAQQLSSRLEEKKSHIHQEMIESILVRIRDNIDKNITIETVAESVFLHPSYLSRICKTITGISLGEQFVLAKINKAKELLVNSQLSVGDIAERLGYTTPRAFYRIFKDYTGLTPSDYRKQEGLRKLNQPSD